MVFPTSQNTEIILKEHDLRQFEIKSILNIKNIIFDTSVYRTKGVNAVVRKYLLTNIAD